MPYIIVKKAITWVVPESPSSYIASTLPRVHYTLKNAQTEAIRLSRLTPGTTFVIMRALDKSYRVPAIPITPLVVPDPKFQEERKKYDHVFN